MTITAAIVRSEYRSLLHSALIGILPAALALVAVAWLAVDRLPLGVLYTGKVLVVFSAGAALMLLGLPKHHPFDTIGPANQATVIRGALVALLAGLIGEPAHGGVPALATATAIIATLLDGVDGWLARRSQMSSGFGARFDMETDALLIAVLATLAWQFGKVGAWVLLSGLLRYLYIAAGALLRWLRGPLPPSYLRKTIAVVQTIALIVVIAPFSTRAQSALVAAMALIALVLSFLHQIIWLWRHPSPANGAQTSSPTARISATALLRVTTPSRR